MSSPSSARAQLTQLNQRLRNTPHFWPYLDLVIGAISMGTSGILVKWANAPGAVSGFYRMLFAALLFSEEKKIIKRIVVEVTPPCDFAGKKKQFQSRIVGGIMLNDDKKLRETYFKGEGFYSPISHL